MKNVRKGQLKTCIIETTDEFERILNVLYPESEVSVTYSLDGLSIDVNDDSVELDDLHNRLSTYYDVKEVTSIHIDDSEYLGVWIVYKE